MRFRARVVLMVAIFGLAAVPSGARAAGLIVSNLNETHSLYDTIGSSFAAAQEFATGSNDYKLGQIFANLGNLDPGSNNGFRLTATLQANTIVNGKDTPGQVLTTFSYNIKSIPTSGFANVEFDPISPTTLTGGTPTTGTRYWFVLGSSSASGSVAWSYANTINSTGPGSLPLFNTSSNGGASWDGPFTPAAGAGPYLIQVNGTAIPEPASWVLGAIGLGGVFLATRWSVASRSVA